MADFILASGSKARYRLRNSIGYFPEVQVSDIDETRLPGETPYQYVARVSSLKAMAVAQKNPGRVVLAADTIAVLGNRLIGKSKNAEEALEVLNTLSGRRHYVLTGVCLIDRNGKKHQKVVKTIIKVKRLTEAEKQAYVQSNEWQGVAGYFIEGLFGSCVQYLGGSFSSVVGLPLCETATLLKNFL